MYCLATSSLKQCINIINGACQGQAPLQLAENLARFHRVQASRGYAGAASLVFDYLEQNGLEVGIKTYPADGKSYSFTQKMFKEWSCTEGWLELTAPWQERLADFNQEEMSLIQRSAAKDYSGQAVPIIYVTDVIDPKEFHDSLEGALLFVENNFANWTTRAIELGALGIITVSIPETKPVRTELGTDPELAKLHANLNFSVYNEEQEMALCGFALTPEAGDRLRLACLNGEKPQARFKVASSFKISTQKNIEALIAGELQEEILLVAHLCHPRNSVNDNISGVVAAVEGILALNNLISSGKLPKPRRTIRLLLMPEFTGTYAFLQENELRLEQIKAGLNLDLVAGRQDGKAGLNLIVDTPDSAQSFVGDLATLIAKELTDICPFGGPDRFIPLSPMLKVPFAGGSDHYILSDPTVSIPTVALTQWPDKFYHTSGDTIDRLDPSLLQRAATFAAAYCYILASLNLEASKLILAELSARFTERLHSLRWSTPDRELKERSSYLHNLYFHTLYNLLSFLPEGEKLELERLIQTEMEYFTSLVNLVAGHLEEETSEDNSPIPLRLFKAPLAEKSLEADLSKDKLNTLENLRKKNPQLRATSDLLLYEADGKKTLDEIVRRVYFQTGLDAKDYALDYFQFLADLDLIKFLD